MKGFIKKDLAMIKNIFKLLGIIIIINVIMGLIGESDISFILPFMSVMAMTSTFSYDTFNHFDSYVITLPNGRKNSVRSKYITTILMILVIAVMTTILSFIVAYNSSNNPDYELILLTMFGNIFGTLMLLSFMYPVIYKFGMERARIGIMVFVLGIVLLISFLLKFVDVSHILSLPSLSASYWIFSLTLIIIISVYLSYKISLRIQLNKEF